MKLINTFGLFFIVLVFYSSAASAETKKLVLKRLADSVNQQDGEVLWIDSDVNGDDIADLIVTTTRYRHEEDVRDFDWLIFAGKSDGTYIRCISKLDGRQQAFLSMRLDRYWIGFIPELNRRGLIHLVTGNGGNATCQLMAVILNNDVFREVNLIEPVDAEENFEMLKARIHSPGRPATNRASAVEVKRYALTSGNSVQPESLKDQTPKFTNGMANSPFVRSLSVENKPSNASPPPSEEPASSTPWSTIVAWVVAVTGLLWLLFKRRS